MNPNQPYRCRHIKINGTQCGSPAMRAERFCFFHLTASPLNCEIKSCDLRPDDNFVLPVLEDATSIQLAISQVMAFLLRGYIDVKNARVLLTACKLASQNLKRMDAEKPAPTQMLVDAKTISTTPIGAANLWSDTGEAHHPHFEPNAEPTAPQTQNAQPTGLQTHVLDQRPAPGSSRKDRRRTSAGGLRAEGEAFGARLNESLNRAREKQETRNESPANKSNDGLPPGTIQACERREGREKRKEYII